MKKIEIILVAFICCLSACDKPAPEITSAQKAPASAADAPAATEVSTSSLPGSSLLNAPGNYIKTTTGHLGAAKEAVKVYEKSQTESMTPNEGY